MLAILLPSMGMAKEIARRVVCSSKLKGLGTALHLYSNDHKDKMIPNAKSNADELSDGIDFNYTPWHSRIVGTDGTGNPSSEFLMGTNHGKLYSLQYIDEPQLYYCPSAFLSLKGAGGKYEPNYYFEDLAMYMPPSKSGGWGGPNSESPNPYRCRSGYMYWTWEETSILEVSNKPLVIDNLVRIGHTKRGNPYAVIALFGDGHVNMTLLTSSPDLQIGIDGSGWTTWGTSYDRTVKALKALQP